MDDLISRQAAIDAIEEYADRLQMVDWKENPAIPYKAHTLNWCINTIRDLPSAQPERQAGKWQMVYHNDYRTVGHIECDQCGYHTKGHMKYNFCPNCGADMRREEEQ